jgi:hypothetical protein
MRLFVVERICYPRVMLDTPKLRTRATATLVCGLAAALNAGCASKPAVSLDPSSIEHEEAAILGHITAYNQDIDETGHCYAEFQNTAGERVAYLSLDETGWVMATVPPGPVKLAYVACVIYAAVTQTVVHQFEDASFVVPGQNKLAYFGHLAVAFQAKERNLFAEALTPPIVKALLPNEQPPPSFAQVADKFDPAVAEFRARFPESANRLEPLKALLKQPLMEP